RFDPVRVRYDDPKPGWTRREGDRSSALLEGVRFEMFEARSPAPAAGEAICPECGARIPVHPDFVTWCDRCNWNLQPIQPAPPRNRVERLYLRLGRRRSRALFEELTRRGSL